MNDGTYTNFNQEIFDKYETDMTELLDKLDRIEDKNMTSTQP